MAPENGICLADKLARLSEYWSPAIVARLNDFDIKVVKVLGEFVWHSHAETDELFLVLQGRLSIVFRQGKVELSAGDLYVVPRGVEHKPVAPEECHVMLIEAAGTINTGDNPGPRTTDAGWL